MSIDEALPLILKRANRPLGGSDQTDPVGVWDSTKWLDIFECMLRIDDYAHTENLSGTSSYLDQWAKSDPAGLNEALLKESKKLLLAVVLVITPRALGHLSSQISLTHWMEAARAVNRVSKEQFRALHDVSGLEAYLAGRTRQTPTVDLPWVLPLPAPSMLRVVQSMKFRLGLVSDKGYREAMRRYIRFYC